MASFKTVPSGATQLCIRNKLLPKPLYATFDSDEQARAYARQLEALLAQGIVPASLFERSTPSREIWTVNRCIAEYVRANAVPLSEVKILDTLRPKLATLSTGVVNYDWAEDWIRSMKCEENLAPSTIRHRHGALARCFDWMLRKHPDLMGQNPLRLLKRGFATYTPEDEKKLAAAGKTPKVDDERSRRLDESELKQIEAKLAEHPEERMFFLLALETAMRMRECYTLDISQVDLAQRTIRLERSKNGDRRQVPLSSTAVSTLRDYLSGHQDAIAQRNGRLFSYWSGDVSMAALDETTRQVSRLFRLVFAGARVEGLHFHDLRHEATCRLYEKTTSAIYRQPKLRQTITRN